MRILFICDEYPPGKTGGIGIAVQSLARQLSKTGHQVWVAGLYDNMYGEADEESDGQVKVLRKRYGPSSSFAIRLFRKLPDVLRRYVMDRKVFGRFCAFLDSLIRQENIEVIEAPDWHGFALHMGVHIKWPSFSVPLIVKSHGSYTYLNKELGLSSKSRMICNDTQLIERADFFCAVSKYTAERNHELFGRTAEVMPNGIELVAAAEVAREKDRVMFSGSLSPVKGVHQLMKAWNIVVSQRPGARLHMYGKGKQGWLKKLLSEEVRASVIFHGHVPRQEVILQLRTAAVAVFPSYSETFGLMAAEAMAAGCPLVYTRRSSGPELVQHGKTGLLVDPDNVGEISEALLLLLRDKERATNFAAAARESLAARFDIAAVANRHLSYYENCIATFKARR